MSCKFEDVDISYKFEDSVIAELTKWCSDNNYEYLGVANHILSGTSVFFHTKNKLICGHNIEDILMKDKYEQQ